MCGDMICSVHGRLHVADCDCPPVEVWVEYDLWPYVECFPPHVRNMLARERRKNRRNLNV